MIVFSISLGKFAKISEIFLTIVSTTLFTVSMTLSLVDSDWVCVIVLLLPPFSEEETSSITHVSFQPQPNLSVYSLKVIVRDKELYVSSTLWFTRTPSSFALLYSLTRMSPLTTKTSTSPSSHVKVYEFSDWVTFSLPSRPTWIGSMPSTASDDTTFAVHVPVMPVKSVANAVEAHKATIRKTNA